MVFSGEGIVQRVKMDMMVSMGGSFASEFTDDKIDAISSAPHDKTRNDPSDSWNPAALAVARSRSCISTFGSRAMYLVTRLWSRYLTV